MRFMSVINAKRGIGEMSVVAMKSAMNLEVLRMGVTDVMRFVSVMSSMSVMTVTNAKRVKSLVLLLVL